MKIINHYLQEQKEPIIPVTTLGRIKRKVTILGLGGDGFLSKERDEEKTLPIIERCIDSGITYFDTARSYGWSENNLGKVLPKYRKKIFLATKTRSRDYDGAQKELEQSLKNLQTDYIDSYQLHHINTLDDVDKILSKEGALKYLEKAKDQGLIKYIGITNHNPWVLREALNRYQFDTVLMILNAADNHFNSNQEITLPICREQNVGVIAMKVVAGGRLLKSLSLAKCLAYPWSIPGVHCSVIGVKTLKEINQSIAEAKKFKQLTARQMKNCESLTEKNWRAYNSYKID